MKKKLLLSTLLCTVLLHAENIDQDLAGFDATSTEAVQRSNDIPAIPSMEKRNKFIPGLTGELKQQVAYSWHNDKPFDNFNSFKSFLFLDYEHKFENEIKIKINAQAYYDAIYSIKGREKFTDAVLDELESQVELFDAYIEGKISENLDFKVGRQVIVWGRSDTIRVTDILNPLDNRLPGMQDIEYLRLPVTMAKLDYFTGDWRITPIAILEQRFSYNPPFGGDFNPISFPRPDDERYHDVTYALDIGAEFTGWDINLYAANTRDNAGHLDLHNLSVWKHEKVMMFGAALNILSGSWLFKTELAHFDGLKYTSTENETFKRTDVLLGVEYNGIANTFLSYDIATRHIHDYDGRLLAEYNPLKKYNYQQAFRVSSNFLNDTLKANYLITLYGKKLDEGGFQRLWFEYDLFTDVNVNVGVVDYMGGSALFDAVENNDMIFSNISYNF